MSTGCSSSGYRKVQNRMKYYYMFQTYAVIHFVRIFYMIDSLHVSASIFHNYQKFRNIQYVLKIDNKQFQDIKLQKKSQGLCLCGATVCPDYQLCYTRVPIWESTFYSRNSQDQSFPNVFARGPLLASKNNQGSSHPC